MRADPAAGGGLCPSRGGARGRLPIASLAAVAIVLAAPGGAAAGTESAPASAGTRALDISEFRIEGASQLTVLELEAALTPFLGPGRVLEDVEKARAALEKAYSDKGYQTVAIAIPQQTVRGGVVRLVATEGAVGRLRVRGARWFSPRDVKQLAPSVAEGMVPNFNALVRDVVSLNQLPDRRVIPAIRAGAVPGTLDVDLNVEDTLPLHGSVELNNRHSAATTEVRTAGSLRYDNLWQAGHTLGFAFQVAPEAPSESKVFSGSYLARFAHAPWLTVTLSAVHQDSDVSLVGGVGVAAQGQVYGGRAAFSLPGGASFFHYVSVGADYKNFDEGLTLGEDALQTPITYVPMTTLYGATWVRGRSSSNLVASVVLNLRGLGSTTTDFDAKRYGASASFIYFRGELSHTEVLGPGLEVFARVTGQYSGDSLSRVPIDASASPPATGAGPPVPLALPRGTFSETLIGSEQLVAGGADSVRGYLEGAAAGDLGAVGSLEVRTPSLTGWFGRPVLSDARLLAFVDAAWLQVHLPLPEQVPSFQLLSVGGGCRIAFWDHFGSALDVGVPLTPRGALPTRVHFRVWSSF